jgi:hypothetical protein
VYRVFLVLDKCWLQAARAAEIHQLRLNYSFVLPTTFYFELLTDENRGNRARLVQKLGAGRNPGACVFLPELLRWEIKHSKPAQPIDRFLKDDFVFNPDLADPNFRFRDDDIQNMVRWENQNAIALEQFKAQASPISYWFPELKGFPPGGRRTLIDDAMLRVANHQTVLEIYSRFRSERLPLASLIDSNWLLFRHTQMNLFAALEFTARYGADATNVTSKRLHNDVLDVEYLIAASMVGAFASRDIQSRKFFKLACPDGVLIPRTLSGPEGVVA